MRPTWAEYHGGGSQLEQAALTLILDLQAVQPEPLLRDLNLLLVRAVWLQKAAVRACRNAIEFNSIPSISQLVPGGYEKMRLNVKIGCPHPVSSSPIIYMSLPLYVTSRAPAPSISSGALAQRATYC